MYGNGDTSIWSTVSEYWNVKTIEIASFLRMRSRKRFHNTCKMLRRIESNIITSQRASAWQCYIGRWLSTGKHAFYHLSAWKTNGNCRTNFGIRNSVSETYKHTKFGWDRFSDGAATQLWNFTVLWLLFTLEMLRTSYRTSCPKTHIYKNLLPPFWNSQKCCQFITIWPIVGTFGGIVATPM